MSASTEHYTLPIPDDAPEAGQSGYEAILAVRNALVAIDALLHGQAGAIAGKAALDHGHPLAGIEGLVEALAGKMPASATFAFNDLSDVNVTGAANGYIPVLSGGIWTALSAQAAIGGHQHLMSEIQGLLDALAEKASASAVTSALAGKADAAAVTSALAGKADAASVTAALADKLDKAGGTMTGPLITTASVAGGAGLRVPTGVAPTTPVAGDIWQVGNTLLFRGTSSTITIGATANLTLVAQATAEAGTNTSILGWSAQRVAQAIAALGHAKLNYQVFTASGTWTKPPGLSDDALVLVELWGGGGGGGRGNDNTRCGGGGGGGYHSYAFRAGDLTSTVAVTIGAGGAGRTASSGSGTGGGTTSFGSYLSAYGGGGGFGTSSSGLDSTGGGGGGQLSAGSTGAGTGAVLGGLPRSLSGNGLSGDGEAGSFGGGGGGSSSGLNPGDGGGSLYGGGGGGRTAGGISMFGGNGGTSSVAGSAPGGGGGAASNADATAGARGECRVRIIG